MRVAARQRVTSFNNLNLEMSSLSHYLHLFSTAHVLLALQTPSSGQLSHTIDAPNSLQQAVYGTLDTLLVGPKLAIDTRIRKWKSAIESAGSGSMTTYAAPSAQGSHLRFGTSDLITLDHFEWPDSTF